MKVDPSSTAVVLEYIVEDDRPISGVPLRDLTEHDLARLAYERSLEPIADQVGRPIDPDHPERGVIARPDPLRPDPKVVQEIHDELVARGRFRTVPRGNTQAPPKPRKPKAKASLETPAAASDQEG